MSLLYYFGVVTLTESRDEWGRLVFTIPNNVTRQLYFDHIRYLVIQSLQHMIEAGNVKWHFYQTGDIAPLCEFIEQHYLSVFDNRDYRWANELTIKAVFITMMHDIGYYVTQTEGRTGREYCDALMLVRNDKRHYRLQDFLFEFKYLSLATLDMSGADVRALQCEEATALPQVQEALAQAEAAIAQYVPNVLAQHSEIASLRCYVIVSLGYDKLVWMEVTRNP